MAMLLMSRDPWIHFYKTSLVLTAKDILLCKSIQSFVNKAFKGLVSRVD